MTVRIGLRLRLCRRPVRWDVHANAVANLISSQFCGQSRPLQCPPCLQIRAKAADGKLALF